MVFPRRRSGWCSSASFAVVRRTNIKRRMGQDWDCPWCDTSLKRMEEPSRCRVERKREVRSRSGSNGRRPHGTHFGGGRRSEDVQTPGQQSQTGGVRGGG